MTLNWKHLLIWLVPCFALLLVFERIVRPAPRVRNYEIFTEMAYAAANESFSLSASLPGGMTQQPVQAGVVVRGQRPFPFGIGPEEAQRAGAELTNPVDSEPATLARGAEVYRVFCALCHGGDGNGRGPVIARGVLPPPSLMGARALAMPDGEMFHVLTLGQGNMSSYAAQVSETDRWSVIRHIRLLQERGK